MTVFTSSPLPRSRRAGLARLALVFALAVAAPGTIRADDEPQHELEESTSNELDKLKPLLDSKNWDGALNLLSVLRAKLPQDSYYLALVANIEAKVYLQKGDFASAVSPWELALRLTDAHHFFEDKEVQEMIYFLAQIYYQDATSTKSSALQQQDFAKATQLLKRWIGNNKKPATDPSVQEAEIFYCSVLYNQAVIDPNKIDQAGVRAAGVEVGHALRMSTHPKETLYLLLLAVAQQQNDYPQLGDVLELLVKQYPGKKDYWSQLAGVYLTLAATEKDERKARELNTRAILAIERAQALGFMRTPKDNYTLVGIYYNVGQFGRATDLLHAGLRDGSIESDQKNWELLGSSYQQVDRPLQAIDALKEGARHFPNSGQLDYQIAQIYYALNKPEESYKALQAATAKGHLEKGGAIYGFLGYVSWELGKLEEAQVAVDTALSYPDTKKNDQQLPKLKQAIEEALRDREAAKTRVQTL